jgi:hypothetical protein
MPNCTTLAKLGHLGCNLDQSSTGPCVGLQLGPELNETMCWAATWTRAQRDHVLQRAAEPVMFLYFVSINQPLKVKQTSGSEHHNQLGIQLQPGTSNCADMLSA